MELTVIKYDLGRYEGRYKRHPIQRENLTHYRELSKFLKKDNFISTIISILIYVWAKKKKKTGCWTSSPGHGRSDSCKLSTDDH